MDLLDGSRCQAFRLRGPREPANNVDGFAERRRGVVVLLASEGMTTPQGVGRGSSRQDVLDGDRVVSLMVARDGRRCIG